jgi:hypothetical protein
MGNWHFKGKDRLVLGWESSASPNPNTAPSLCLTTSPAKISRSVRGQIGIHWAVDMYTFSRVSIIWQAQLSNEASTSTIGADVPHLSFYSLVCLTKAENSSQQQWSFHHRCPCLLGPLPLSFSPLRAPLLSPHPEPGPKYLAALLWIATLKRNNCFICLYCSNFALHHFSSANKLPSTQPAATRQGLSNQKRAIAWCCLEAGLAGHRSRQPGSS